MPRLPPTVVGALLAVTLAGCGDGTGGATTAAERGTTSGAAAGRSGPDGAAAPSADRSPRATTTSDGGDDTPTATTDATAGATDPSADAPDPPPRSWTATCPTATRSPLGCAAVRGRVLAIQSYDPDGDGDLHVIAVGGDVTGPGITVFDVRPSLRPGRDPVKGEYVTGAGPVFRGSLRQRQIQVDAFRVWRP